MAPQINTRSKTGCITCKVRRVKCDETRPRCNRCTSTKRICDGYVSHSRSIPRRELADAVRGLSVIGPASQALNQSPLPSNPVSRPASSDDAVYFDLFRQVTVPGTCIFFPSSFWRESILQVAHSEPAVWHATLALGALHHRAGALTLGRKDDDRVLARAELHYGKAMALARDLDSTAKVVTLSIALVAAANMLERWSEMQTHVMAGLKIIAQDEARTSRHKFLRASLTRFDLLAMTYGDSQSPYPYNQCSSIYTLDQFLSVPHTQSVSYEELSSELFGLMRAGFLLDDSLFSGNLAYGPWVTKYDAFLRRLTLWESSMAGFEDAHKPTNRDQTTRLSLRLYHVTLRTMIQAGFVGRETRYDALLGRFEYMVNLAATLQQRMRTDSAINFSLELGLIIPLGVVIHRCRHHALRRAALRILKESNRVEGMWRSDTASAIFGALVAVEEGSVVPTNTYIYTPFLLDSSLSNIPWRAWSKLNFELLATLGWNDAPMIPEEKRVKEFQANMYPGKRCAELRLITGPVNDGDPYGEVKEVTVQF
ncbi:hypothetical protein V2G26_010793 [Clonostachys chloroleuca]